jgi:hypothetical protein
MFVRATRRAAFERHINFHRRISARVEDFARLNVLDFCHGKILFGSLFPAANRAK